MATGPAAEEDDFVGLGSRDEAVNDLLEQRLLDL